MKKLMVIIGICFLLVAMPAMTAISLPKMNKLKTNLAPIKTTIPATDNPPDWANGNFTGVWGLNILGIPTSPIGWITGYYQNIGLGKFAGVFAEFNETNATGALVGFMLWVFFIGGVGSIATGNGTYVAGIGVGNETHYYVRLHGIIGPSYYIHVKYTKFE